IHGPVSGRRRLWCAATAGIIALVGACGREPLLVARPAGASRSLIVRNVRVFDAPAAALREGLWDVVVRDGRIAAIERPGAAGKGLPEIDGQGGTLVPGLVDVHTHTGSTANPPWQISLLPNVDANLAAFLYAGVTTVLDLGNLTPAVFRERERVATGAELGPRLYAAGPVFTAPGGHPAEVLRAWLPWYLRWYVLPRATREVATAEDGRRAVAATLAVWDVSAVVRAHASDFLPIEREVARPDLLATLLAPRPPVDAATTAFLRAAAAGHHARRRNIAKLRAAGVQVLAGSDAANPGQLPGAGLHLELAKLVDAGLAAGEVLRIA